MPRVRMGCHQRLVPFLARERADDGVAQKRPLLVSISRVDTGVLHQLGEPIEQLKQTANEFEQSIHDTHQSIHTPIDDDTYSEKH